MSGFSLLTRKTTESADTLGLGRREGTDGAGDSADAGTVLDRALAHCGSSSSTSSASSSTSSASGSTAAGGVWWGGAGSGRSLAAGDAGAGAGAVLGDGHGLEHGLGLSGGGVDGEGHALAAVALLLAVEPWSRGLARVHPD